MPKTSQDSQGAQSPNSAYAACVADEFVESVLKGKDGVYDETNRFFRSFAAAEKPGDKVFFINEYTSRNDYN